MLLTDAGSPMIKMYGLMVESGCHKMVHLLCIAHSMSTVAEQVQNAYERINDVIMSVKKIFKFSHYRHLEVRKAGIKTPPTPVVTRWGTWLRAASYYADPIQRKRFINLLRHIQQLENERKKDEDGDITKVIWLLENDEVVDELEMVHSTFTPIAYFITKIEQETLSPTDFFKDFDKIRDLLLENPDSVPPPKVRAKLGVVLDRNKGLKCLEAHHKCKFAICHVLLKIIEFMAFLSKIC